MQKPATRRRPAARPDSAHPGFILGRALPEPAGAGIGFHARSADPRATRRPSLIRYSGDGHLVLIAPTGTGKTSGPIIANLLDFPGQVIAIDIKGELRAACGRRRAEFGPVHVLDLDDGPRPRAGLNPLDLAWRQGGEPGVVARSFAAALVQRPPAERDPFWNDWAESLISAGFCGLLERGGDEAPTVGRLFDLFHSDDVVYNIARMLDEGKFKSRSSCSAMAGFLNLPERETRPSVQGTVQTHLRLFDSDLVRRLTDTTTIDREALVRGDPCTLFIAVPPDRLAAFAPLLRLWLTGLIHLLTRRRAPRAHRTLMLIDEAAQVGRMEAFLTASTLMRSWGLTVWSAWQNIAQIEIYGAQAKTLVDNAGVIQFFGVRNRRSAQEFAALVGGVDADAIMAMRPDEQLILVEGGQPRRARKLRYWEERRFHGLHDPNPMASAAGP